IGLLIGLLILAPLGPLADATASYAIASGVGLIGLCWPWLRRWSPIHAARAALRRRWSPWLHRRLAELQRAAAQGGSND
ncbi:hypothetical protein, partial [uncultured Chloroflexus sp.]|uniref:hypothetical protein n=1 Tax=uncultured Chloroflexus sp. TaxID=214040 RepID=UPI0026143917